jgi:hypothetical protein
MQVRYQDGFQMMEMYPLASPLSEDLQQYVDEGVPPPLLLAALLGHQNSLQARASAEGISAEQVHHLLQNIHHSAPLQAKEHPARVAAWSGLRHMDLQAWEKPDPAGPREG